MPLLTLQLTKAVDSYSFGIMMWELYVGQVGGWLPVGKGWLAGFDVCGAGE